MNWTEDDYMSPEQEREIEAREECARRGIDPDEVCADGGVLAWMVVDQELRRRPLRIGAPKAPAPDTWEDDPSENWFGYRTYLRTLSLAEEKGG